MAGRSHCGRQGPEESEGITVGNDGNLLVLETGEDEDGGPTDG
jgi:hypothetical protein